METKKGTIREYFSQLNIIHIALLMGQILFLLIIYFINHEVEMSDGDDLEASFKLIAPLLAVGGFIASLTISKSRLKNSQRKGSLKEKLEDYRAITIIKLALIEGPSLFAIISYFITADMFFFYLALILVLVFVFIRPTKKSFIKDLLLNPSEIRLVEDDDSVVFPLT